MSVSRSVARQAYDVWNQLDSLRNLKRDLAGTTEATVNVNSVGVRIPASALGSAVDKQIAEAETWLTENDCEIPQPEQ